MESDALQDEVHKADRIHIEEYVKVQDNNAFHGEDNIKMENSDIYNKYKDNNTTAKSDVSSDFSMDNNAPCNLPAKSNLIMDNKAKCDFPDKSNMA